MSDMREPVITVDLEEDIASGGSSRRWYGKALRSLASQLGVGNDFYYPLLGAAKLIDGKNASATHERRIGSTKKAPPHAGGEAE